MTPEIASAITASAGRLGIDPTDLGTAISFETGGTLSPGQYGGAGGKHLGLIQFGPEEQKKYGVKPDQPFGEQMNAVEAYLRDRGLKPGMGMLDLYSTINAGSPGRYNASDAANGGTPGSVSDKVFGQMAAHRAKMSPLFGGPVGVLGNPPAGAQPMAAVGPAGAASPGQPLPLAPAVTSQPTLADSLKQIGGKLNPAQAPQPQQQQPADDPFTLNPIQMARPLGLQQANLLAAALMKKPGGFA